MTPTRQRIGYIDALRGLIMLLVVMTHIHRHSFGGTAFSFNSLISAELMPVFFFISGLLLFFKKEDGVPKIKDLALFTGKKLLFLSLPAFIFMAVYGLVFQVPFHDILWDAYKYGFWFTLVLAGFYLIFAVLRAFFETLCKISKEKAAFVYLLAGLLVFLGTSFIRSPFNPWKNVALNNLFCLYHFQHFLYFTAGALAGCYYETFLRLLQKRFVLLGAMLVYISCITLRYFSSDLLLESLLNPVIALTFITILWQLFKTNETALSTSKTGKALTYIGKYTLDIYLLHTILLPFNLQMVGAFFDSNPSPVLEFALSFAVAIPVIVMCLLISKFIRVSDLSAKVIFGRVIHA